MNAAIIIQARMGSTRLPGKSVALIDGQPLIKHVVRRALQSSVDKVIVAVPMEPRTHKIIQALKGVACQVYVHPGDPNNVVGRYYAAAALADCEWIVRVPGDNPCVMPEEITKIVERAVYIGSHDSLYTNLDRDINRNGYPGGLGAEVYHRSLIQELNESVSFPMLREHPHLTLYAQDRIETLQFPLAGVEKFHFDVNTKDDLSYIRGIYAAIGHPDFGTQELLSCASSSAQELRN